MALFVVICGALLMLGGGYSLLMGFDVVMTERGAAMAIGGTAALAGGVIAIGIGGVLLRLSQILRVLEQRPMKARTGAVDRPVVPIKEPETTNASVPSAHVEDVPASRSTAAVATGVGLGAVAGAVALSTGSVTARETATEPTLPEVHLPPDVLETPMAAEATVKPVDHIIEALKAEIAPPPKPEPVPVDLEEELARALAEVDPPPAAHVEDGDLTLPPLRSIKRRRAWSSRKETDEPVPVSADMPDLPQPEAATDAAVALLEPDQLLISAELPEPPAELESEVLAAPEQEPLEAPKAEPERPKVLGTYNVGGRTYSMYADGSVEAVTEFGVERFASMDALRRHLAQT